MSPAAAAAGSLALKVTVGDTWMPLQLQARSDETVAALKARALATQKIDPVHADRYEVKLGGGRVVDETRSLQAAGVKNGMAMIILARHRRPVR